MAGRTIGQAIIEIIADSGKFTEQLGKAAKATGDDFGQKANAAIGGVLVKGAQATGLAVTAALGTALWKGFERLTAIDNARAKLSGLGHDAGTVEQIMNSALKSVKGTAFGMGEAASLAAVMVAAGIKPGQELERVLGLVGDTATIAGAELQDMGLIWGSVAARGKLQGDDMLQMMSRGIPVLQLLANHLGLTSAEVSDMVSKGKIDFATFAAAMEKGMGGAALKSGETFSGAMKNVQAALSRLGASLLGGVFEKMPDLFTRITTKLDEMGPAAERLGQQLGGALEKAVGAAEKLGDAFMSTVGFFQDNDVALKALIVTLGIAATYIGATMAVALARQTAALATNTAGWFAQALAARAAGTSASLTAAQVVFSWVAMGAAAVANAIKVAAGWALMGAQATAAAVRMAAAWLIALGPIGLIIAAVAAVAIAIALNWDTVKAKTIEVWGSITAFLSGVWESIKSAASAAWESIKSGASGIWEGITSGVSSAWAAVTGFLSSVGSAIAGFVARLAAVGLQILDAITLPWRWAVAILLTLALMLWTNAIQPAMNAISNGVRAAFTAIGSFLSSVWASISAAASAAWQAIYARISAVWSAIRSAISSAVSTVTSVISAAWNAQMAVISAVMSRIQAVVSAAWNAIRGVVSSVMSAVQGVVSAAWAAVTSAISSAMSRVQSVVSSGFNAVRSTVSSVLGALGGIASSAMSAVVGAISGAVGRAAAAARSVVNGIKQAFLNVVGQMSGIGANIVQGVANGISGAIGRVRDAAARIADAIPGPIKRIMGLESPSRVMRGFGEDIGEGLILGMESMAAGARRAAGGLAGSALDGVSGLGPGPRAMPAGAGLGLAAAGGGVTYGGATTIHVTVSVDDLARMGTVAEFVDMLGGVRVRERQTARSGLVTA